MSELYSMQDVLNPQFLSNAYTKIASLSVQNPLLDYYNGGVAENSDGDQIEMVVFDDDREAAPVNTRGAPARTLGVRGAGKKYFSPVHAFNEITLPMNSVQFLREDSSPALQNQGRSEIKRQMELFARRHRALRAVTLAKSLCDGIVYYDAAGAILESSSTAVTTIDLGVSATHKSQLNHAAFGADIIGTAWDSTSALILEDLEQIREAAEYDKVPAPKHVWLHTCAKQWFRANTELKAYIQYADAKRIDDVLSGYKGNSFDLGDFTFHFYNGTYIGADGSTIRPIIPKTKAIITPDIGDGGWFRHYEHAEYVPTSEGPMSSIEEALGNISTVYGDFAYVRLDDNPVKVSMRMGCNFLYAFADPNAVWMPTVDF